MPWGKMVQGLSLSKLNEVSLTLAQKLRGSGYEPDHVLYVERAGLLVGYEISKYFDSTISGIYASRSGHSLKSKLKLIFRCLPRGVTHLLRNIEFKSNIHSVKKERSVYIEGQYPPNGKRILMVDDAIDTGYSLQAVLDFLLINGYDRAQIKIAVLATTQNDPICRADISLFEQVSFAFPWSYDSKEYNRTWRLYERIKASIS